MLRLALLTLKARKGGFAGTFVALLLGAAVLSACGILLESGIRAGSSPSGTRPRTSSSRDVRRSNSPSRTSTGRPSGRRSHCPSGSRCAPRPPTGSPPSTECGP